MRESTDRGSHAAGDDGRTPGAQARTADDSPSLIHRPGGAGTDHDGHHRTPGQEAANRKAPAAPPMDRRSVVEREKNALGGVKVGSAFFGWLTATGTAVLLTALLAATGTAVGLAGSDGLDAALTSAQRTAVGNAGTIGVAGAIAVLVVLLIAYFCGGYVAGRMARFNGVKQGVAVWVWAVVIAVVVAVVAAVVGNQYDVLGQLNSFPRIPADSGDLTAGSVLTVVAAAVVALLGAVLGGLAGMRFHRRVDRAGLGR